MFKEFLKIFVYTTFVVLILTIVILWSCNAKANTLDHMFQEAYSKQRQVDILKHEALKLQMIQQEIVQQKALLIDLYMQIDIINKQLKESVAKRNLIIHNYHQGGK